MGQPPASSNATLPGSHLAAARDSFQRGGRPSGPVPRTGLVIPGTEGHGAALGRGLRECGGVWNPPTPELGLTAACTLGLCEGEGAGPSLSRLERGPFPAPHSTLEQQNLKEVVPKLYSALELPRESPNY